jgi:hypothetical protein
MRGPSRDGVAARVVLVVGLALALRLWRLDAASLWLDESYSLRDAGGIAPFNRIRPVYYMFLRAWLLFGTSDAWARLPSAFFGAASVYVLYRLGRQLAGARAALVAALLLAVSPLAIDQSQQVRMYALGTLLGLLGSLALSRALDAPDSRAVPLWAGMRLLLAATAPFAVTLVGADALLVGWELRDRHEAQGRFLRWSGLLLLWLPLVAATLRDPATPYAVAWLAIVPRPGPAALFYKLVSFTTAWPTDYWESVPRFPSRVATLGYSLSALVLVALIAVACRESATRIRRAAAWACVPLGLLFLASFGPKSLWLDRYLYFASPYVLILVAVGFVRISEMRRTWAAALALAYALALGPALLHYYRDPGREDWRGVAGVILERERPGDRVIVHADTCLGAFRHYYRGTAAVSGLPYLVTGEKARAAAAMLSAKPGRLWIVHWHFGPPEWQAAFRRAVEAGATVTWYGSFEGIDLFLAEGGQASAAGARAGSVRPQSASGAN